MTNLPAVINVQIKLCCNFQARLLGLWSLGRPNHYWLAQIFMESLRNCGKHKWVSTWLITKINVDVDFYCDEQGGEKDNRDHYINVPQCNRKSKRHILLIHAIHQEIPSFVCKWSCFLTINGQKNKKKKHFLCLPPLRLGSVLLVFNHSYQRQRCKDENSLSFVSGSLFFVAASCFVFFFFHVSMNKHYMTKIITCEA